MNLLKSPLRRVTAAVGGTLLGLAGVVVFAAPASAHHPIVQAGERCVNNDGTWRVTWHVRNSEQDIKGSILAIQTNRDLKVPTGLEVGTELPKNGEGYKTGVQADIPANVRRSVLDVKGRWVRDGQTIDSDEFVRGVIRKPTKKCGDNSSQSPSPAPSSAAPSASASVAPSAVPSASASAAPSTSPSALPSVSPSVNPSTGEPALPTPIVDADCTSLTIGLDNPDDGLDVTLGFKTDKGETRTVEIAPGEQKTEKFSATTGFKVTVTLTIEGESASETITYEQPDGCTGTGGGDELALTGAAAGSIAGGAGLLLAVGGFLFLMARRRKVKFTA